MKTEDWFWAGIEAVIWYFFIYYALFALKTDVNLWNAALILLVLAYVGFIACPWFRETAAWKRLMRR